MTNLQHFLELLTTPAFIGIALLMLSTFLLGYFLGGYGMKATKRAKIETLKKQVNSLITSEKVKDIETIFTEIKPKIIQVVKEQQEKGIAEKVDASQNVAQVEKVVSKTRSNYVNYALDTPLLDFESFGYGNEETKDRLTQIDGIGPYIEEKLNEIGIFNFDQISKFQLKDIRILTSLIDFFPGRIERDDWVGQAKELCLIRN